MCSTQICPISDWSVQYPIHPLQRSTVSNIRMAIRCVNCKQMAMDFLITSFKAIDSRLQNSIPWISNILVLKVLLNFTAEDFKAVYFKVMDFKVADFVTESKFIDNKLKIPFLEIMELSCCASFIFRSHAIFQLSIERRLDPMSHQREHVTSKSKLNQIGLLSIFIFQNLL